MHVMIEVHLAPGASGEGIFTQETLDDTQAQIMTREEASKLGFAGLPEAPEDALFIVVTKSDERRILNVLEMSPLAVQFRVHDVDL
jgi:hypothetical protein